MKRATFSVLFYVKHTKQLKDGTLPIFARITVNGQRAEFSVQRSVQEGHWDSTKGMAKANTRQNKEINAYLETVKAEIFFKKRELHEHGKPTTAAAIKNAYLNLEEAHMTLLKVFSDHNKKCESLVNIDYVPGTILKYKNCLKHLRAFIVDVLGKKDLCFSELSPMVIKDFETYLKTACGCQHNTALKYLTNLKKIVRIALANGWLKSNPFSTIVLKFDEVDMAYLDDKELARLMAKKFDIERMQQVKDVYLFCCFTGLAFIDVKSLCTKDLVVKENQLWIRKKRQKTKNWCDIPLLEPAQEILEKYKLHPVCIRKGLLLPVLSNQKMNAYLKEIADLCGINKHLSTHTARHTFATTVTLANQVSIEVVSKMLGHSSINMTKKYARVVDDLIKRDMEKIIHKFDTVASN